MNSTNLLDVEVGQANPKAARGEKFFLSSSIPKTPLEIFPSINRIAKLELWWKGMRRLAFFAHAAVGMHFTKQRLTDKDKKKQILDSQGRSRLISKYPILINLLTLISIFLNMFLHVLHLGLNFAKMLN